MTEKAARISIYLISIMDCLITALIRFLLTLTGMHILEQRVTGYIRLIVNFNITTSHAVNVWKYY